jgi:hypothetical protein
MGKMKWFGVFGNVKRVWVISYVLDGVDGLLFVWVCHSQKTPSCLLLNFNQTNFIKGKIL